MKKWLKSKRAFTLIEVILAVALVAVIALPLLTVFLQSVKADTAAKGVLNANYISQGYTEQLDALTYEQVLSGVPVKQETGEYYLSAQVSPHGYANAEFDAPCEFIQLTIFDNETMLAVFPDGAWHKFPSVPSSITLDVNYGVYSLNCDGAVYTGDVERFYCMLNVNAMQKNSSSSVYISTDARSRAALYVGEFHEDDFTLAGQSETYVDMTAGETSLIHVETYVYSSLTSVEPVSSTDGYIYVRNW